MDNFDPETQAIERRRQMAQMLLQQSQQSPQGRMVGRVFVGANPLEYLAQGLKGYSANQQLNQADTAQQDLQKTRQEATKNDMAGLIGALRGKPAQTVQPLTPNDDEGNVNPPIEMPAQPGSLDAFYKRAAEAKSPQIQQMGLQGAMGQAQEEAKRLQQQQLQAQMLTKLQGAKNPQEALAMGIPAEVVKNFYESGNWGKEKGVAVNGQLVDPRTGAPIGKAIPKQIDPSTAKLIQDEQGNMVPNPAMVKYEQLTAPLKAPKIAIDMSQGQKGFENESSLRKDFKSEPIYKDYADMQAAYGQVKASLKKETPIGDVAGATKIMKLLDPGSVVRESELGIAMAAAGRMDRLQNFLDMWSSGKKLTPTQRKEFGDLSDELFNIAGKVYNDTRSNYENQGKRYGLNTDVLGAKHTPRGEAKPKETSVLDEADAILRGGK